MEKWGTGYRRIIEDCDNGGYPYPGWQELSTVMRVKFQSIQIKDEKTMNDVPVNVPVNKRQKWFLEQLNKGVSVKAADISKKFNVSSKTARRDIKDLVDYQVVEFSGAPKTGQYILLITPSDKTVSSE